MKLLPCFRDVRTIDLLTAKVKVIRHEEARQGQLAVPFAELVGLIKATTTTRSDMARAVLIKNLPSVDLKSPNADEAIDRVSREGVKYRTWADATGSRLTAS
eukprot:329487-Hanusia_phi.AAC.1